MTLRLVDILITHDIYEEWALDKIIERAFIRSENYQKFFNSLGSSLPIRRAFRIWLSEKLLHIPATAKHLIENIVNDDNIENFPGKMEFYSSVAIRLFSNIFSII